MGSAGQGGVGSPRPSPQAGASEAEVGGRAAAGGRAARPAEVQPHRRRPGHAALHPQVTAAGLGAVSLRSGPTLETREIRQLETQD